MLTLRTLKEEDTKLIFDWSNEPEVRANSLNSDEIVWDSHVLWMNSRLNRADVWDYILEKDRQPCSFVRFERKLDDCIYTSIVVSKDFRKQGIGKKSLSIALIEYFKLNESPVYAQILKSNKGSIMIFEDNGFHLLRRGEVLIYKREKL